MLLVCCIALNSVRHCADSCQVQFICWTISQSDIVLCAHAQHMFQKMARHLHWKSERYWWLHATLNRFDAISHPKKGKVFYLIFSAIHYKHSLYRLYSFFSFKCCDFHLLFQQLWNAAASLKSSPTAKQCNFWKTWASSSPAWPTLTRTWSWPRQPWEIRWVQWHWRNIWQKSVLQWLYSIGSMVHWEVGYSQPCCIGKLPTHLQNRWCFFKTRCRRHFSNVVSRMRQSSMRWLSIAGTINTTLWEFEHCNGPICSKRVAS